MTAHGPECCHRAIIIEGRTYNCRLPREHSYQHRARVAYDTTVSLGQLEKGAEIVWPNEIESVTLPHGNHTISVYQRKDRA